MIDPFLIQGGVLVRSPVRVGTWSDSAIQVLKEFSCGIHLQGVLVNSDTCLSSLKLTNTCDGNNIDIATELIKIGVAAASKALKPEPGLVVTSLSQIANSSRWVA